MLVSIAQFLQAYWLIPILITVISLYCFAWFCRKYWIPAKKLSQKIDTAIANIKSPLFSLNMQTSLSSTNKEEFRKYEKMEFKIEIHFK